MTSLKRVKLTATTTQGTWSIPASCVRLDLSNHSRCWIRFAFAASKVAASPLVYPPEFETLEPGQYLVRNQKFGASDTLYFASNSIGAEFSVIAYVA